MYHSNEQGRNGALMQDAHPDRNTVKTIPVFTRNFGSWQFSVQREAFNTRELTQLYDRVAHGWSQTLDRLNLPKAYGGLLCKVFSGDALNMLGARPCVLECGIGTGALSVALAETLPMPWSLEAIDISPRMLELAQERLRGCNIDMTMRQANVCDLPYSDGVFDVVMIAHVLEHLDDPSYALHEMTRVLKPGGILFTCITRRSLLGMLIHLKWRTHQVSPLQAEEWVLECGIEDVHCLVPDDSALFRQLSIACVGRKSLAS